MWNISSTNKRNELSRLFQQSRIRGNSQKGGWVGVFNSLDLVFLLRSFFADLCICGEIAATGRHRRQA